MARRILNAMNACKVIPVSYFKFRKVRQKPVELEAAEIDIGVFIETDEGLLRADENYVLIRGVDGELRPCLKTIFEQTYEEIDK